LLHVPVHARGRAGKKNKAKEEEKLHSPSPCHFYLHKAGAEAEEWGTAVGSDTQGRKEQSLYHLHTNAMVTGR